VLLIAHAPRAPTDAEWSEFMDSLEARDPTGVVVIPNGVRPAPRQRAQIQERMRPLGAITAVLTDSVVSRGAVTALSWFRMKIRAFPTADPRPALVYAGVPEADVPQVLRALEEMSERVMPRKAGNTG
jgi:hypothetical protein